MAAIRRDMVLVPEQRDRQIDLALAVLARLGLGVLDRPPSIAILLPEPSGLVPPHLRDAPLLDRLLLGLRGALLGRRDDAGINELPGHG